MASTLGYLQNVLSALPQTPDITYKRMMGEYIIYYRSKVIGGIYDDRFLVKPTKGAKNLIPTAELAEPYPGAKPMLHITDLENSALLYDLLETLYADLPSPKRN